MRVRCQTGVSAEPAPASRHPFPLVHHLPLRIAGRTDPQMEPPVADVRILSLSRGLPPAAHDRILSTTEQVLDDLGAVRVWIEASTSTLTVWAEFGRLP